MRNHFRFRWVRVYVTECGVSKNKHRNVCVYIINYWVNNALQPLSHWDYEQQVKTSKCAVSTRVMCTSSCLLLYFSLVRVCVCTQSSHRWMPRWSRRVIDFRLDFQATPRAHGFHAISQRDLAQHEPGQPRSWRFGAVLFSIWPRYL